jgi:ATP-dependent DNA helicase RecQ
MSTTELEQALSKYFGFSSFRGQQKKIISNVNSGRDTMIIMPTGAGKSLCYQLPALMNSGVTLVISPLVALMKDQVDALVERGIAATTINSSISSSEQRRRLSDISRGTYRLVYVAPERFTPAFIERMKQVNIRLLAVDEAHCLSQWGHDFRPDYLKLGRVRAELGNVQTIALTATATPEVQEDIAVVLGLKDCDRYVTGFDRDNLHLEVRRISGKNENKYVQLRQVLDSVEGIKLIYCATRKNVERITVHLREHGHQAGMYHAGLSMEDRTAVQNAFMRSQIDVVVATNAFGMGVDKSDIRCVVHWEFPGTVEAYYQEIGRAGRDGLPSRVVLLYRSIDDKVQRSFIESSYPSKEWVSAVWDALQTLSRETNDRTVWVGHDELSEYLPSDINGRAVGSCFYTLDREGYIRRLSSSGRKGRIWLDQPPTRRPSGLRGSVYDFFESRLKDHPGYCLEMTSEDVAEQLNINREQLSAAMYALREQRLVRWEAPERVGGVELLRFGERLEMDMARIERRRNHEFKKLELMKAYAESECRRRYLIEYFGEKSPFEQCGTCDCCVHGSGRSSEVRPRQLIEIQKVLSCLVRMSLHASRGQDQSRGFGRNLLIKTLRGSNDKVVRNWGFDALSTHGILKGTNAQHVHELLDELVRIGLLETEFVTQKWGGRGKNITYPEYRVTDRGNMVMRGQTTQFEMRFPVQYSFGLGGSTIGGSGGKPMASSGVNSVQSAAEKKQAGLALGLLEQLKSTRKILALRDDVPLYAVATNRCLDDMVQKRPETRVALQDVHGMGPKRINRYGRQFLDVIVNYKG